MNPIHFDFTLVFQAISFLLVLLFICLLVFLVLERRKRNQESEVVQKLDYIIERLDNPNTSMNSKNYKE